MRNHCIIIADVVGRLKVRLYLHGEDVPRAFLFRVPCRVKLDFQARDVTDVWRVQLQLVLLPVLEETQGQSQHKRHAFLMLPFLRVNCHTRGNVWKCGACSCSVGSP